MEEVDGILLISLRQAGCPIDDKVASLNDFDTEAFYRTCTFCLRLINDKFAFPENLPRDMSSRFRVCTTLAESILEVGFNGECGYNHFLYPNLKDTRKILSFLMEALPKQESGDAVAENLDAAARTTQAIHQELSTLLKKAWMPPLFSRKFKTERPCDYQTSPLTLPQSYSTSDPISATYVREYQRPVTSQPIAILSLAPSVFEDNVSRVVEAMERQAELDVSGLKKEEHARRKKDAILRSVTGALRSHAKSNASSGGPDLLRQLDEVSASGARSSRFARQADFAQEKEDISRQVGATTAATEEEDQERRAKEIEDLQSSLAKINSDTIELQRRIETETATIRQIEENIQAEDQRKSALEQEYLVKKKVLDLLEDKDANMKALRQISVDSAKRLMELATEWENHRGPIVEKYRAMKDALDQMKGAYRGKLEEMKVNRERMKDLIQEARDKEETLKKLHEEYEKLPKDIDRNVYIRRIMDIIKNVKKQQAEVNKILIDNRNIQKEINTVSEALQRSFVATEELVFKEASKDDPAAKNVYKNLVFLREAFDDLIKTVEETGSTKNQIRDLEQKIESMRVRNDTLNVERIETDLAQVKEENKALVAKIKSMQQ